MTVSELITALQSLPQDATVTMETNGDVTRNPDWQEIKRPFVANAEYHNEPDIGNRIYRGYSLRKDGNRVIVCISDWHTEP